MRTYFVEYQIEGVAHGIVYRSSRPYDKFVRKMLFDLLPLGVLECDVTEMAEARRVLH